MPPFKLVLNGQSVASQLGRSEMSDSNDAEKPGVTDTPGTRIHRYSEEEDVAILKEVIHDKAFGKCPKKWQVIHSRLGIKVKDYRCIQRRYDLMVRTFKEKESQSRKETGTEENPTEKDHLLQEILELMELPENQATDEPSKRDKRKAEDELKQAQYIRDAAMDNLTEGPTETLENSDETTPTRKRRRDTDFMSYLRVSDQRDHETKVRNLELEGKRLELMEREIKLKEDNEAHRRNMEARQIDLEEKRLEIEVKKAAKESEEKAMLYNLLQNLTKKIE